MNVELHDDAIERFGALRKGERLCFVPIADVIIVCKVQCVISLEGGDLPLVGAILGQLQKRGALTLDDLTAATGACGKHGRRFIAEVVSRLLHAGWIELIANEPICLQLTHLSAERAWQLTPIVRELEYLPRAGQIATQFSQRARREPCIRLLDDEHVCSKAALSKAIEARAKSLPINIHYVLGEVDPLHESMLRSKLSFRRPVTLSALLLDSQITEDTIGFRCYFIVDRLGRAYRKEVWSYSSYSKEDHFTAYLNARSTDYSVGQQLFENAEVIAEA